MSALRIFLVDDHALLREGLRALIALQSDMQIVGDADDGLQAIAAVRALVPDVVVMDISMPALDGAEATKRIKEVAPSVRVLALTAHEEMDYVQLLLNAGATGFLLKRAAASDLVAAIRSVASGRVYLNTTMAGPPSAPVTRAPPSVSAPDVLSEREAEVLRLIARGYAMRQIGTDLNLSTRTLETYKARAMEKLSLSNRADLVRYAQQRGWFDSD